MYFFEFKKDSKIISLKYYRCFYGLLLLCLSLMACTNEPRQYLYPGGQNDEVQRICRIASKWSKKSFSIINGKIQVINPRSSPYLELHKPLPDGFYHCGRADSGRLPCARGTTRTLSGERCSF